MRYTRAGLRSAFAALLMLAVSRPAHATDWMLLDDSGGVQTYSAEIDGSPLLGFRGVSTVDVHISRLLGLFMEPSKSAEWIDLLAECYLIRPLDDRAALVYQRYDVTWPVADRDYVLKRTLDLDATSRAVTLVFESAEDPTMPATDGVVRAEVMGTFWRMTALDDGRTLIDSEAFTDPKGALPAWAVNMIQRGWARKSIDALVARASNDDVVPYPGTEGW